MTTDDPTESYDAYSAGNDETDMLRRLDSLPSMTEDPVVWDAKQSKFVPASVFSASQRAERTPPPNRHVVVEPGAPDPVVASSRKRPASPAPTPASAPAPGPAPAPRARRKVVLASGYKRRLPWPLRWLRRLVVGWLVLSLLVGGGMALFGWTQFNRISKASVGPDLSAASGPGENILIVGTDSRAGVNPNDPNAKAFLGAGEPGASARTDTILVLHIEGDKRLLMSIPRDLWIKHPKTGKDTRINAVYQDGASELVRAVQNLGIPVQHYVEINFVSFGSLIDSVGGIDIEFPHAARDTHSGLYIDNFGLQHLNGTQALAFVRSRYYEEAINGKWVTSGLADLDRVKRQQAFLKALLLKLGDQKNPGAIAQVLGNLGGGLRIDQRFSYFESLKLAWRLRSFSPESRELKVAPRTTTGGADILDLLPASADVIKEFQ